MPITNNAQLGSKLRGVKGWLLFLCLCLTLFIPLITIFNLLVNYNLAVTYFRRFPDFFTFTLIDSFFSTVLMIFAIYAGIALWKIKSHSLRTIKFYFLLLLIYLIIAAFLPFRSDLSSNATTSLIVLIIKNTFGSLIFILIWYLYLKRSKRVKLTYGEIDTHALSEKLRTIKSYNELFDLKRDGFNYYVFIGFISFWIFGNFSLNIVGLTFGHNYNLLPISYISLKFIQGTIYAFIFLFVSYLIANNWFKIIIWGVLNAVGGIGMRAILRTFTFDNLQISAPFAPDILISTFVYGILFMAALVLAVRFWGLRKWNLIIGLSLATLSWSLLYQFISIIINKYSFFVEDVISTTIEGVLAGILIYIGLYYHFQNQKLFVQA